MKKSIVKDVLFLGQKSEEATPEDRPLALDLQDTFQTNQKQNQVAPKC